MAGSCSNSSCLYPNSDFPGFGHLYELVDPLGARPYRGDPEFAATDPVGGHTRGESQPARPVVITWAMGQAEPGDVVWTTDGLSMIISDRVRMLLEERHFRGWTTYPVVVIARNGERRGGYAGLAVTARCGPTDDSQGEWVRIRGGTYRKGVYFDPATWDGSDLFMPSSPDSGLVFAVDDVRKAFASAKITNVRFEPLSEVVRAAIDGLVDFSQSGPPPAWE